MSDNMECKFINSLKGDIFCCHSHDIQNSSKIGVLLVQPFAEERIHMQRALYNLSKKLTEKNIPVFRFDFYGQGDSSGNLENATLDIWEKNLQDAVAQFKSKFSLEAVVFCGFRFGATLSLSMLDNQIDGAFGFVLIDPIIDGKKYIEGVLRTNLTYQMVAYGKIVDTREKLIERMRLGESINIDGYLLSRELFNQISGINLMSVNYKDLNVLLLHYSKNTKNFPRPLEEYANYLNKNNCSVKKKTINDPVVWKASEIYQMNLNNTATEIENWALSIN